MQEIMVLMKKNEMEEHHPAIVDGDDLRAVNEAHDWVQDTPVQLVVRESAAWVALVYVEVEKATAEDEARGCAFHGNRMLTWDESEAFADAAEYEVQKVLGKQAKAS